jgi:hypothetical protein
LNSLLARYARGAQAILVAFDLTTPPQDVMTSLGHWVTEIDRLELRELAYFIGMLVSFSILFFFLIGFFVLCDSFET